MLYDGVNAVQELSGSAPVVNRLTGGVDEFFSRTDSAGTTFPLTDALGSTIALTDSSGAIQTQYSYEPFGATTETGTTSSNWYQFTGRANDGTGLYYYRARYYSPRFQRFISEDPMGFGGGDSSLYGYVREDPTDFTDPGGNLPVYSWQGSAAPPTSGRKDKCYTLGCLAKNIAIGVAEGLAFGGPLAFAAAAAPDAAPAGDFAPAGGGWRTPAFLGQESGPPIPVPEGATGPTATRYGTGVQWTGGAGGNGLAPDVNSVRVMDPTPQYPNGYVNYGKTLPGGDWQPVNPYTGKPIPPTDSWWHLPLGPRQREEEMVTHAEDSPPLELILGESLDSVCFVLDYITFHFGNLGLAALAAPLFVKAERTLSAEEPGYRDALCSLIQQEVVAVSDSPQKLEVTLAQGAKLVIPLDAEYPPGPEMATLSGKGLFIMAWLRPSPKP